MKLDLASNAVMLSQKLAWTAYVLWHASACRLQGKEVCQAAAMPSLGV